METVESIRKDGGLVMVAHYRKKVGADEYYFTSNIPYNEISPQGGKTIVVISRHDKNFIGEYVFEGINYNKQEGAQRALGDAQRNVNANNNYNLLPTRLV